MKKMLFKTLLLLCCTGLFAQNGNNNFHEYFNSVGEWRATGKQTIAVRSLDLVMDDSGKFIGISVATNTILFDDKFQVATVDCQGALYAPGTDPFADGATPVAGSEFSCGSMVFHRIPKP